MFLVFLNQKLSIITNSLYTGLVPVAICTPRNLLIRLSIGNIVNELVQDSRDKKILDWG